MFEKITAEQAGISSESVIKFIKKLEKRGATMHGILFMRGDKIFAEGYWKPFHQDFCHRMYSQTKSFVSVAIGLLEEEGKICLDDKIIDYFSEKIDGEIPDYLRQQSIREMLTMTTVGEGEWWFTSNDLDRTHLYFNSPREMHPSGTIWKYDSSGSQVLCSLVEKLSKKTLLEYLQDKLFKEMGVFQTASILKTPNGDSWGDSAMLCTLRDMVAFGKLVMDYGVWNGKRLMNEKYLRQATSAIVHNAITGNESTYFQGYGYQIWRVCGNGFAFIGMGDQLTVCYPEKKLIFACVSDNQGSNNLFREMIFSDLEDMFVDEIKDEALPKNREAEKKLNDLTSGLKLRAIKGLDDSIFREELNGAIYECSENAMGIKCFSFIFHDKYTGEFHYTNAQGSKTIPFGVNCNVFGKFPQLGYANERGAVATTDGFMYDDAVSFAWTNKKELMLFVQVIDKYFGNMSAKFSFKKDEVYAVFNKTAEFFLMEYEGELIGKKSGNILNKF